MLLKTESNRTAYDSLLRLIGSGRALAFAGAGVTNPLGYPTWAILIDQLAAETRQRCGELIRDQNGRELTVAQIVAVNDLLFRAELFKLNLGERYFEVMQATFAQKPEQVPSIQDLVELPFRHMLTSNYDPSLEIAHERARRQFNSICLSNEDRARQFLNSLDLDDQDRYIVHVHGRFDQPRGIVLTEADYGNLYNNSMLAQRFWDVIPMQRCVFFGFSFNDSDLTGGFNLRNFNRIRRQMGAIRHFAVVAIEDSDKEPGERARYNLLYGIEPVFFDKIDAQFSGYGTVMHGIRRALGTPIISAVPAEQPQVAEVPEPAPEMPVEAIAPALNEDIELLRRVTTHNLRRLATGGIE